MSTAGAAASVGCEKSLPVICRDYNSKVGCNDGNMCTRLHICERFVKSTCTQGNCNAGHDITADQPMGILARYGFNVEKGADKLLAKLRASSSFGATRKTLSRSEKDDCNPPTSPAFLPAFYTRTTTDHATASSSSSRTKTVREQVKTWEQALGIRNQGTERVRMQLKGSLESSIDNVRNKTKLASKNEVPRKSVVGVGMPVILRIPEFCFKYNSKGNGCTTKACEYLHMCRHFVEGTCKFDPCKKSHYLMSDQPKAVLISCGFDVAVLSEQQILIKLKEQLLSTKRQHQDDTEHDGNGLKQRNQAEALYRWPQPIGAPGLREGMSEMWQKPVRGVQQSQSDGVNSRRTVVSVCSNYNYKDGCNVDTCQKLHICRHFVGGICKFDPCKRSHYLMSDQPKKILVNCGFDIARMSEKLLLEQLREMLMLTKKQSHVDLDGIKPASACLKPSLSFTSLGLGVEVIRNLDDSTISRPAVVSICSKYNYKDGCTVYNCQKLHICRHFVEGTCKFDPCKRSHCFLSDQTRVVLANSGFDVDVLSNQQILKQVRVREQPGATSSSELKSSDEIVGKRRNESSDICADPKVCIFHLFGHCIYKNNDCFNYHSNSGLPYQWQWNSFSDYDFDQKRIGKWFDFCPTVNVEIETKFCDVEEERVNVQDDALGGVIVVNFESMTFGGQITTSGVVRRLGTEPVATTAKKNRYTTVWNWYCQSDDQQSQWQAYPNATLTSHNDLAAVGGVSALEIELKYLANPLARLQYQTTATMSGHGQRFLIDLKQMTRTELSSQEVVKVRRRPVMYLKLQKQVPVESSTKDQSGCATSVRYPDCWNLDSMKDQSDFDFVLVPVSNTGQTAAEYNKVFSLFAKTMPGIQLKSVMRIQNRDLWESFDAFKTRMNRKRSTPVVSMSLFHGTKRQYFEAICQQGFDWRMCGASAGTAFGKGSYFARDASYSKSYTDCSKMFIVQVLVGDYTQGHSSYVRPPPKDKTKPYQDLFDSVVNDVNCPSIFVSFERNQSYPEYVIEYLQNQSLW